MTDGAGIHSMPHVCRLMEAGERAPRVHGVAAPATTERPLMNFSFLVVLQETESWGRPIVREGADSEHAGRACPPMPMLRALNAERGLAMQSALHFLTTRFESR